MFFLNSFPAEAVDVGDKEDGGEDDNGPVLDAPPIWLIGVGVVFVGTVGVTAGNGADVGEGEEDEPYPHSPECVVSHCLDILVVVKRELVRASEGCSEGNLRRVER